MCRLLGRLQDAPCSLPLLIGSATARRILLRSSSYVHCSGSCSPGELGLRICSSNGWFGKIQCHAPHNSDPQRSDCRKRHPRRMLCLPRVAVARTCVARDAWRGDPTSLPAADKANGRIREQTAGLLASSKQVAARHRFHAPTDKQGLASSMTTAWRLGQPFDRHPTFRLPTTSRLLVRGSLIGSQRRPTITPQQPSTSSCPGRQTLSCSSAGCRAPPWRRTSAKPATAPTTEIA